MSKENLKNMIDNLDKGDNAEAQKTLMTQWQTKLVLL